LISGPWPPHCERIVQQRQQLLHLLPLWLRFWHQPPLLLLLQLLRMRLR
jgi:hypothetical protein